MAGPGGGRRASAGLAGSPDARVLLLFCGQGTQALELARTHPGVRIVGFDPDDGAIAAARRRVLEAGLETRVQFEVGDPAEGISTAGCDFVLLLRDPAAGAQPWIPSR